MLRTARLAARTPPRAGSGAGYLTVERDIAVEVKIGVQHAPREIVFESNLSPEEVEKAVSAALADSGPNMLSLEDEHGRKVLVPSGRVAYVEIGEQTGRKVGFGAI